MVTDFAPDHLPDSAHTTASPSSKRALNMFPTVQWKVSFLPDQFSVCDYVSDRMVCMLKVDIAPQRSINDDLCFARKSSREYWIQKSMLSSINFHTSSGNY